MAQTEEEKLAAAEQKDLFGELEKSDVKVADDAAETMKEKTAVVQITWVLEITMLKLPASSLQKPALAHSESSSMSRTKTVAAM
jgi:hypothetical protein